MKLKPTLQVLMILALFAASLGVNGSVKAAPASGIIVNRDLVFWEATYSGYVDANRFERWQFAFGQTYTFTVTAIQASGDLVPRIRLLDQNGNEISTQQGTLTSTQPIGNYSVQIEPVSGSGSYTLTI